MIRTTTSGRIAGFIAEPIQGVGGFITPPKEYFQIVAEIVTQVRRGFHQRRSADRLGPHRRQVVRHRAMGRRARHHHQRQGTGQRFSPIGLTMAQARNRRCGEGRHHLHFRRQSRGHHRGQSRDRLHRRTESCYQRGRGRRVHSRQAAGAQGEAPDHRRRARHGPAAGHRTGGGSREQNARARRRRSP